MEQFRLLVVQTGGTIDKDYPKRKGGYAFEICDSGAITVLSKVRPSFPYRLVTVCQLDSQQLTDQHRQEIAQVCKNAGERNILVTHGTDTILQTAVFLARSLSNQQVPTGHRDSSAAGRATSQSGPAFSSPYDRSQTVASTPGGTTFSVVTPALPGQADTDCCSVPDKVVVLTGAFLPERFKDTDADFNIGVAVGAMQGGLAAGVYVSLGGRVWPWDRVTRVESGEYVSLQ